jgi:hypothetical protein
MIHAIDTFECGPYRVKFPDIRVDQFRAGIDPIGFAGREVINDTNPQTAVHKRLYQVRADEAGAASHEHIDLFCFIASHLSQNPASAKIEVMVDPAKGKTNFPTTPSAPQLRQLNFGSSASRVEGFWRFFKSPEHATKFDTCHLRTRVQAALCAAAVREETHDPRLRAHT